MSTGDRLCRPERRGRHRRLRPHGRHHQSAAAERPPALAQKDAWTGFYDPEVNAHFMHGAGDSRDNGVMWVYRYKRAAEKK